MLWPQAPQFNIEKFQAKAPTACNNQPRIFLVPHGSDCTSAHVHVTVASPLRSQYASRTRRFPLLYNASTTDTITAVLSPAVLHRLSSNIRLSGHRDRPSRASRHISTLCICAASRRQEVKCTIRFEKIQASNAWCTTSGPAYQ